MNKIIDSTDDREQPMSGVEAQTIYWRFSTFTWMIILVITILILLAFHSGFAQLVDRWNEQEEYSHGYFIPLVAIFLIWQKRVVLGSHQYNASWSGVIVVIVGSLILFIGEFAALYILIHYAFIIVILGLALTVLGVRGTRVVIVPILFLLFAVPLPYFIDSDLSGELQLVSSQLGVAVIRFLDIPVYLEGNIIDLGIYQLQVVEACSGLRYLYPLMGFTFICVYLWREVMWKKVVVFLSAIPITIGMNSLRIGVTGVFMEYFGIDAAKGFIHDFEGWLIFLVCVLLVFVEIWILSILFGGNGVELKIIFTSTRTREKYATRKVRRTSAPLVASVVVVAIVAGAVNLLTDRVETLPKRSHYFSFPMQIGEWAGRRDRLSDLVLDNLELSDYILADYRKNTTTPVNLYIAYYENQRKGRSPHSPRVCIPAGGWQITRFNRITVPLQYQAKNGVRINRVLIERGGQKQLVYYWFQQRGRILANEYTVKWYLLRDAIVDNRTDGALVRITTRIGEGETVSEGDRRLLDFSGQILMGLDKYIPG